MCCVDIGHQNEVGIFHEYIFNTRWKCREREWDQMKDTEDKKQEEELEDKEENERGGGRGEDDYDTEEGK
jgi:hypothetical protein